MKAEKQTTKYNPVTFPLSISTHDNHGSMT